MKKITFLLICLTTFSLQASIVVKDIVDYTFVPNGGLSFDFNSDGNNEFTFDEMGGTIGCFFDPANVNFVGTGTFASGHGWDIMKSLSQNTAINNTSVFAALADAYINPIWANTNEMFPAGDSYIGVKFKLGANVHYGWILVNSTGGASGTIKIKSYAYENVPNQAINAGQLLGAASFNSFEASVFPVPSANFVQIETEKTIVEAVVYDVAGKKTQLILNDKSVNISGLTPGVYMLHVLTDTKDSYVQKIVKN